MVEPKRYTIPAGTHRIETEVARSRFIATVGFAPTPDSARVFIAQIRAEMPQASHHVYAFRSGFGSTIIEGMSDDGEPSGTAGPPVLAVLRGANIGDIVIVVTRYFGGTKLGTGGLVRAYSEAAHVAVNSLATEEKIEKHILGIELPYNLYQPAKDLVLSHGGVIDEESFDTQVTMMATFPIDLIPAFERSLSDLTAGRVHPVQLD